MCSGGHRVVEGQTLMYRGRLIHRFKADIRRLDLVATGNVAGYDRDFREPKRVSGTAPEGEASRVEMDALLIPCQYEKVRFRDPQRTPDGNNPQSMIEIIVHRRDLQRLALMNDNGVPTLRAMDRIDAIYEWDGTTVVQDFSSFPTYIDKIEPEGATGVRRGKQNLFVITVTNVQRGIA